MKLRPQSSATRTLWSASSSVTARNSCPSEDAPKLRMGTGSEVLPRRRVFISTSKQRLHVPGVDVLSHVFRDNGFVRLQQIGVTRAGLGGGFEGHVQELTEVGIEFRVVRDVSQRIGKLR